MGSLEFTEFGGLDALSFRGWGLFEGYFEGSPGPMALGMRFRAWSLSLKAASSPRGIRVRHVDVGLLRFIKLLKCLLGVSL